MKTFKVTLTLTVDDTTDSDELELELEESLSDFCGIDVDSCYAEEVE